MSVGCGKSPAPTSVVRSESPTGHWQQLSKSAASDAPCREAGWTPRLEGRVRDYGQFLTNAQEAELSHQLNQFEERTRHQFALLTVEALPCGETIESFSLRTAKAWGLGQRGRDNGLLITVSRKEQLIRIEVGTGLAGVIPREVAQGVLEASLLPKFTTQRFYSGTREALTSLMEKAKSLDEGPS